MEKRKHPMGKLAGINHNTTMPNNVPNNATLIGSSLMMNG
jgi:hypothetical protein